MEPTLVDALPQPVARCVLDVPLAHLDRLFDYRVPAAMAGDAVPGARVVVRFAGRLVDGFVVERRDDSDAPGTLAPLHRVVSAEPVLTPAVVALLRVVADHYAGTVADLLRMAVPPRHAATEKAAQRIWATPQAPDAPPAAALAATVAGRGFLAAVARGETPRAFWQVPPVAAASGDVPTGVLQAAGAALASKRSTLVLVPQADQVGRFKASLEHSLGKGTVGELHADLGPSARYRNFLAALRGQARVLVGTRTAVWAPLTDLGLIVVVDDGSDLYSEPRAPYPHARDVAALRTSTQGSSLLIASTSRTCEVQWWVDRGWLQPIELPRDQLRRLVPPVRVTGDSDLALERDPLARQVRLPGLAFSTIRAGLASGPVLVQVPRRGYLLGLACEQCREPLRCLRCHGPLRSARDGLACGWCAALAPRWRCRVCQSTRWRAPVVGAARTADELGRAFPGTRVVDSSDDHVVDEVSGDPALVVATPGAEPLAEGGFSAAVLLDAQLALSRADLRAGEESLRRWLAAAALVRPADQGGTVCLVGPPEDRAVQAMVRTDPAGFAERELADRLAAAFPPAVKMVTVDGIVEALREFTATLELPATAEVLGPVPLPAGRSGQVGGDRDDLLRLTLRCPAADGRLLVKAVREALGVRSARKLPVVRVTVDPVTVG